MNFTYSLVGLIGLEKNQMLNYDLVKVKLFFVYLGWRCLKRVRLSAV